mmetsp:Transcript_8358/g.16152  ORF Transcript_8358/g.16152 Transcript_8358/m.16152 type:complete len:187 (-) Transcript_8358:618-1178(-)
MTSRLVAVRFDWTLLRTTDQVAKVAKVDLVTAAVDLVVVVDSGEVGEISWGLGKWNEEEGRGWTAMEVVVVLVVVVGHGVRGVAISWAVDRWRIAQQGKARQEAVGLGMAEAAMNAVALEGIVVKVGHQEERLWEPVSLRTVLPHCGKTGPHVKLRASQETIWLKNNLQQEKFAMMETGLVGHHLV